MAISNPESENRHRRRGRMPLARAGDEGRFFVMFPGLTGRVRAVADQTSAWFAHQNDRPRLGQPNELFDDPQPADGSRSCADGVSCEDATSS